MVQVKCNFSWMYSDDNLKCSYGCESKATQSHILECKVLTENLPDKSILAEVKYVDLFGNVDDQKHVLVIWHKDGRTGFILNRCHNF